MIPFANFDCLILLHFAHVDSHCCSAITTLAPLPLELLPMIARVIIMALVQCLEVLNLISKQSKTHIG
jgi:hypothetical protein